MPVHNTENHNLVWEDPEEHTVGKPLNDRTAGLAMYHGERAWPLENG